MSVRNWIIETAEDIIWEFEQLLCDNNIKINNKDIYNNKFNRDDSYINCADYDKLKENIVKQLEDFKDYVEEWLEDVA